MNYFDISVSDSIVMKILKKVDHLCDVEDSNFLSEFVDVEFDELDKLSTLANIKDEVQAILVLECVFELDYVTMGHHR